MDIINEFRPIAKIVFYTFAAIFLFSRVWLFVEGYVVGTSVNKDDIEMAEICEKAWMARRYPDDCEHVKAMATFGGFDHAVHNLVKHTHACGFVPCPDVFNSFLSPLAFIIAVVIVAFTLSCVTSKIVKRLPVVGNLIEDDRTQTNIRIEEA